MSAVPLFSFDEPFVVDVIRGDVVEASDAVDVVVVDESGDVLASAGEPERVAYFRSSLKPIQASVSIEQGWIPSDQRQIAVASASHNAEPEHLAVVRSILTDAGLTEDSLRCPPSLPLLDTQAALSGGRQRVLSDCSGKHAGFLAACVARGYPTETYLERSHPLQEAVLARVDELTGGFQAVHVDGCGAPIVATSLRRIGRAFARGLLASKDVADAMRAHPFLVAGTGRICTDVMTSMRRVAMKAGAEGMVCALDGETGCCVVLKSRSGMARFVVPVAIEVLARLGLTPFPLPASLARHAVPPVLGGGVPVGALRLRRR
ncbi:MAG: asparaginase [Actinomycetota bacterium]